MSRPYVGFLFLFALLFATLYGSAAEPKLPRPPSIGKFGERVGQLGGFSPDGRKLAVVQYAKGQCEQNGAKASSCSYRSLEVYDVQTRQMLAAGSRQLSSGRWSNPLFLADDLVVSSYYLHQDKTIVCVTWNINTDQHTETKFRPGEETPRWCDTSEMEYWRTQTKDEKSELLRVLAGESVPVVPLPRPCSLRDSVRDVSKPNRLDEPLLIPCVEPHSLPATEQLLWIEPKVPHPLRACFESKTEEILRVAWSPGRGVAVLTGSPMKRPTQFENQEELERKYFLHFLEGDDCSPMIRTEIQFTPTPYLAKSWFSRTPDLPRNTLISGSLGSGMRISPSGDLVLIPYGVMSRGPGTDARAYYLLLSPRTGKVLAHWKGEIFRNTSPLFALKQMFYYLDSFTIESAPIGEFRFSPDSRMLYRLHGATIEQWDLASVLDGGIEGGFSRTERAPELTSGPSR